MRERGLKSIMMILWKVTWIVAPRAGAWIEIFRRKFSVSSLRVAPRAGAWIEIKKEKIPEIRLPVAPRAGAWIEMTLISLLVLLFICRSPCGSVD